MDKAQQEARRNSKITDIIILALLCIILCGASIYFYSAYDGLKNKLANNNETLLTLKADLLAKEEELNSLKQEREDFNNLDEKIKEIKEVFFKNAVKAEELARSGEADFKVCYLTFDDGPYEDITPGFLDVLEEYDVQATFFCLEKEGMDDIYIREKMNCHTIGNHTASHAFGYIYSSVDAFINDIIENRNFIQNLLGITTEVMRFPGGSPQISYSGLSAPAIVERLRELHYGYIDWTLMTGDGGGPTYLSPEEFMHNVTDYSNEFNVMSVLMHDYATNTLICLPDMIEELTRQGFIFLPLSYDAPIVRK